MKITTARKRRVLILLFLLCVSVSLWLQSQPAGIEIICQKSYFTPNTIHVKKGAPVRLFLRSVDVVHGFAVDEFGIAREISPGPAVTIRFTPDREGAFPFYCVVRCGKEHLKMRGTIIVEP